MRGWGYFFYLWCHLLRSLPLPAHTHSRIVCSPTVTPLTVRSVSYRVISAWHGEADESFDDDWWRPFLCFFRRLELFLDFHFPLSFCVYCLKGSKRPWWIRTQIWVRRNVIIFTRRSDVVIFIAVESSCDDVCPDFYHSSNWLTDDDACG